MLERAGERRILIVEDEKVVADTLGQILSAQGYSIRVAYSAEAAIEKHNYWAPDLAILDVMLPKMNGIELAVLLKDNYPNCHVLLFSGQPSVETLVEKARGEGYVFEILAKPVHPSVMLNAISTLLCSDWVPVLRNKVTGAQRDLPN
jgi:DNA-binding NtrC family response regulator